MCVCVCYRTSSYIPGLCVQSEAIYSFLYCVDFAENVLLRRYISKHFDKFARTTDNYKYKPLLQYDLY